MTQFIESLYRLYKSNNVTKTTLDKLLSLGKITQQEYEYIISVEQEEV